MQNFDLLKIQKEIEEKRLIWGHKIENSLLKKLQDSLRFSKKIFAAKNFTNLAILLVVFCGVLMQSTRDIGHDSAVYLEIASKMLAGGKYYQDFFEANFPLSFWLTLISVFFAKIVQISPIITTTFFVNFLGILSIFWTKNILESKKLRHLDFLAICFAAAFFLRPITSHFNEFFTKTSYFLIFLFPYFALQLVEKRTKFQEVFGGILAGLIFCLKPHYGLVVVAFELFQLCKTRDLKASFCLRNYLTLVVLVVYFLAIFLLQKDFLQYFQIISQTYVKAIHSRVPVILKEDIFPLILFFSLTAFLLKKNEILQKFYLLVLATILIVLLEVIGGFDQRFIIYCVFLPCMVLTLFLLIQERYFDFKKQWIWLIFTFVILQFDAKNIFSLALDICSFWFVFAVILRFRETNPKTRLSVIFYPNDFVSWLTFLFFALSAILLVFNHETAFVAWLLAALLFILLLGFYQKSVRKFSLLSAITITVIFSYVISIYLAGIFNYRGFSDAYFYKSPNYKDEKMIKIAQQNLAKKDQLVNIGYIIPATYPAMIYMKKENQLPQLQMALLFEKVTDKNQSFSKGEEYLFSRLKQRLQDKKNKLVFVEIQSLAHNSLCEISFLEYYFRDKEFREIFLKNYRFLNRITEFEGEGRKVSFYAQGSREIEDQNFNKMVSDIEVYVRK